MPCEERLRDWGLFSLEKTLGGPKSSLPTPIRCYWEDGARVFTELHIRRTRDYGHELEQGRFRREVRKSFFFMRTDKPWLKLPREVV